MLAKSPAPVVLPSANRNGARVLVCVLDTIDRTGVGVRESTRMLSRLVCVWLVSGALPAMAEQQRCVDLNRLSLPGIAIRSATPVPAGMYAPPGVAPRIVPSFCRVVGTVLPELGFEVWLPDQWNRKYVGVGNGGLAGNIVFTAMFDPLSRGYAVGSTDTGHVGANTNDGTWALGHLDRV